MNEYLSELYDWISSQDTTFQGRRSREEFISKMQDDANYNQQMYTWISGVDATFKDRYTTDAFQTKTGLKKKDKFEPTSQKVVTESITEEKTTPTLSDASESKFDYESFIDKDEDEAIYDLQSELTGKGYSVEETGIGNALLVTDNITGEVTEIDLKPISWFGKGKYRAEEIEKVKKLIQTPTDSRRSLLSTNQLEAYTSDKAAYLQNLKSQYPNFQFEYVQDPQKGGTIRITKGDAVGEFQVTRGIGSESKQFTDINNFLYQNMTDEEASDNLKKIKIDQAKIIQQDIENINTDIDVSMESSEADFYGKDYFKGLFKALEKAGVSVPEEARRELEGGYTTTTTYNPITGSAQTLVPMGSQEIKDGIQKYFGSDPAAMEKINQYNLAGTIAVRKQKIDRAKKLATEIYYDNHPNKESVKEIVRQINKDITDKEADIIANIEMARKDITKLLDLDAIQQEVNNIAKKNEGIEFEVISDENKVLQNIISSEPVKELEELKTRIKNSSTSYRTLLEKSKYELEKINSKSETVDQFMEAANRNYNLIDMATADLKNAFTQLGGGIAIIQTLAEGAVEDITGVPVGLTPSSAMLPADVKMKMIRGEMAESREKVEKFYKTKRTYDEAVAEGSKFEFGVRTFAEQTPNIALAFATAGVGPSIGLGKAGIQTLIATEFGLTSAGQKYDELTTRQEFGAIAEKALKELESIKGIISDEEYLVQKYELERALEDSKISSKNKTLSVIGTGLVEGVVTRFIGTAPNSIKVLKDLRAPTNFMDDILRSNYTAAKQAVKEFGKRTGGEIIEETSIDLLTQINDYAFLGDQIDLSSLDDVAVTSIITSGAMNTPSTAYSTIMTQTNVNRYKNKINSLTQEIGTLKDMLMDPDISNIQRTAIHNNINKLISGIAEQTTNMEGDALLMGADNIKEMLTLSGVRNSMLKKAGVENDDSYDIANAKIDNYLKSLDQDAAKKFTDQMKYIDNRRNEVLKSINYEGAIERVFGEKGTEIAKGLDPTLTPQQKYVEVYKQVRQEINDNALKEFNDAIQKQETGDIPDAKPAEGVQEVEEEVRVTPEQEAEVEEKVDPVVQEYLDELNKYRRAKTKNAYDLDEKKITQEQYEAKNKRLNQELTATQKRLKMNNKKAGIVTRDENWDKKIKENLPESNISTSEDLNKKLEEGTWGMLTAENPNADIVTDKQNENANKRAEKWLKSKGYSFTKIFGKYGNSEQSYLVDGLTREDAIEFAKEFSQESVATNEGLVYQDGSMNPKVGQSVNTNEKDLYSTIKTSDGLVDFKVEYDFSQRISPEAAKVEGELQQLRDMFKAPDQRKQVENAEKALKSVTPDVKIILHESEQAYAEATNEQNRSQKTAGEYNPNTKTIHINPEKANARTVAHEVFHAILLNMVKTDAEAQRVTEAMMKAVAKVASPELKAYLDDFASNYAENIRAEEKLAELVGKLASEYDSLPKPTQNVIKRWLDRLAKMFGLKPFTDEQVIDVLNTIAGKVARGEAITESDVSAISEGASTFFSGPTTITKKQVAGEVKVSDTPADLSFVTSKDIIDINSLINEISSKGQKVWFWVADQLGRGMYMDTQVGTEHFLDAGPSYALDPKNRNKNVIWATGKGEKEVLKNIDASDYIFIISGSPIKSKLFNKRILNILKDRVGDYNAFKEGALNSKPTKTFRDVLEGHDSWESLTESPDRKKLLNAIESVKEKKNTPLKTFLQDNNAFIELNELRDGFYAQNDFQMNDVMLVLKPTAFGGKSDHSTYENDILGDVIGVPDKKVNAYDLMPEDVRQKYSDSMTEAQKAQVVAPYGIGIKGISRRKQNITNNEIIQRAKEAGISDAAIREYLKERGMTPEGSDRAVKNYNDKVRLEAQKKEGIKIIDNKTLKGLDRILKFLTSARAYTPKSMQVAKESRNGYIEANTKKAKFTLNKLEKEIKKYKGDKVALMSDIDAYLRGDQEVVLPDNIQKVAFQMRTHIDTLSKALIESGAVSDVAFDDLTTAQKKELIKQYGSEQDARANYKTSKENVLGNIGSYLTRSYEVYSNKNWKDKVAQEVVDKAKNYLKEQMRPAAEKQAKEENRPVETVLQENVDALVDSLLDRDQAKAFISNANDASKNLGILRGRKDIPAELRALMGEYTSPAMNYIISVNKVATLTAQQNFLNKMKEVGEGVFFFKDDKTKGFRTKIAAEGTETMSPLNGMYTSPEIAEALKGGSVIGVNLGPLQSAVDFYLKSVGLVKYNKTILSPGTHAKNFLGNMFFMLANGHIDPRDYYNAAKVVGNDLFGGKREDLNNKLLEYIEAGVINQSVTLRDLRDMMSGKENRVDSMEDFEKRMMQRFNKPTWTKLKSKPESWYQAEDDYFKILAYEANKARYSKALFGKPFDQLNDKQKAEVKKTITEIVKNTLPNYDRLPEVRKLMRAVPLAGTFISFHIEAIRTAWNTLDVARKELANPKTRSIGVKRLSGIMALIGIKTFVLSSLGIGDEDDEMEKSVRTFLPPWSKNSSIVIESTENGVIKYRDLSASDPWGVVDRAFIGYMSGEDSIDGFINSLDEVFGPFVEPDILFNALSTIRGKVDKDQPFSQNADIVMKELYKVLTPGALTSGERILLEDKKSLMDLVLGQEVSQKKQGRLNEFIGQVSGYKIREIKVEDAIFFKFRDIASAGIGKSNPGSARTAASLYNRTWYKNQEGEATEEQLQTAYEKSNKAYKDAMAEAVKYYQDALKLGVSSSAIEAKMKSAGFRKQEIESLSQGVIPELKQKEPELSEYEKMLRKRTRRKR